MNARLIAGLMTVLALGALAGCMQKPAEEGTPSATQEAREPKNLVERLTIHMDDEGSSMFFSAPGGPAGGSFQVSSGKIVGIHLVNVGAVEHEVLAGRGLKLVSSDAGTVPDGYNESLLGSLAIDAFVYEPQKVEVGTEGGIEELEAEPGGDLWIRTTFPDSMKGTWEIGCFKPGHYQAGMKATLAVV